MTVPKICFKYETILILSMSRLFWHYWTSSSAENGWRRPNPIIAFREMTVQKLSGHRNWRHSLPYQNYCHQFN